MWVANEEANEPFIKDFIDDDFAGHPAVVVGAGYGIDEQLDYIAKNARELKVFSTDKARPHFKTWFPTYTVALNTEKTADVKVEEWFKDITSRDRLVLPVTAHPSHVRIWMENGGGPIRWMIPANIDFDLSDIWSEKYGKCAFPRGANSGEFGYLVAAVTGCNPIGLIGMPYAWKTLVEAIRHQSPDNYEYHEFCVDGKHCYTTLAFMEQRTEFLEMVGSTVGVEAYNCSEGGILYDQHVLSRMSLEEFVRRFANGNTK